MILESRAEAGYDSSTEDLKELEERRRKTNGRFQHFAAKNVFQNKDDSEWK